MTSSQAIILCGRGPSWQSFRPPPDIRLCAISSAIEVAGYETSHWVVLDDSKFFPGYYCRNSFICKHTGAITPGWDGYPNVTRWRYVECPGPLFDRHDDFVGQGHACFNHSLLAAVQIMAKLGYKRQIFAGCDLNEGLLPNVAEVLKIWRPAAKTAGVEWFNASPASSLSEWMPAWHDESLVTAGHL